MKRITIYQRTITERTNFKKWRFKDIIQYTIKYNNKIYSNHYEDINNNRLRIDFVVVLDTRKKEDLENFISMLGKTNAEKEMKKIIIDELKLI